MANSIDFRADQVQTSKIIVTGSTPQKTLLIYGIDADGSPANQGNIDPAKFDTTVVGTDVFLFVSGTTGGRGGAIPNISVFGGDLHVSGNLTVDGTSPGGGGTNFFTEIAFEQIQTTGSVDMTYLSSSAGGEITGSFTNGQNGTLVASGVDSHAEGQITTASGISSHAEGAITLASGDGSHSEGTQTVAYGDYSHAQGWGSETFGTGSFAAGLYTVASGAVDGTNPPTTTQAAFGKYNLQNNTDSLFVVGDGLDDSNRHDVLRVNSGSVQITGSLIASTITGSISGTVAGNPFIVAGSNIVTNYNSLGQWEITGSGGGINPGTSGTLARYNSAGTNVTDSQIRETATLLTLGPSNNSRLFLGWQTNNSALEWQDGAGNTPFAIYQNYSNLQTMFLGISPGLGNYSQIAFTYGGSISTHGIYFNIQGGIQQFSVVPDGIETGNINSVRMRWSESLGNLRLTHPVFGTRITLDASTGNITTVGSVQITGSLISPKITGSIQYVEQTNTTPFLAAGSNITTNYNSLGQWEITGSGGGGGGGTQKQFVAKYEETTSTTPIAIGQFSWIPSDYASLTTLRVRAIMSTDGTANHTGSLEIYNLTSAAYVNLIDTPSVSSVFVITSSTPTLVTSSNLLAGGTNFDNVVDSIYEVRISGSTANTMIIGGVELVYS